MAWICGSFARRKQATGLGYSSYKKQLSADYLGEVGVARGVNQGGENRVYFRISLPQL